MSHSEQTTIAAIATPIGVGGIAVLRISGPRAKEVLKKIFPAFSKFKNPSRKMIVGWVFDPQRKKKIDQAMACYMKAPRTLTGEDVVEISCHGGVAIAKKILSLILSSGAVLADRGEFTKRAFLNKKLDLTQAESVLELVKAPTEKGAGYAVSQLEGRLSKVVEEQRSKLIALLAQLEAQIDFSEDLRPLKFGVIIRKIKEVLRELDHLLATKQSGKIFRQGVSVAIVGRPNVGKSSLLNALLREERAIVTKEPGTTRDSLAEQINLDGLVVRLVDTAGVRRPRGRAEKAGIKRAQKEALSADYLLATFDGSEKITAQDLALISIIKNKKGLLVFNKTDLPKKLKETQIKKFLPKWKSAKISALFGQGVPDLTKRLNKLILKDNAVSQNTEVILNARHIECLERARAAIVSSLNAAKGRVTPDLLAVDIKAAILALGEISGAEVSEEVINTIFGQFCVGK